MLLELDEVLLELDEAMPPVPPVPLLELDDAVPPVPLLEPQAATTVATAVTRPSR